MAENLKSKVVTGVLWRLLTQFSTKAVTFVVGIILARLLGPEAYGTIAILMIFVSLSEVIVDSGFGAAVIQRKDIFDVDLNSVFCVQFSMSLLFYGILFMAAPYIEAYYQMHGITQYLRVIAIVLPLNSIRAIQTAIISRNLLFNLSFPIAVTSSVVSGAVGVALAYLGFGVWALVWSTLSASIAATIVAFSLVRWVPRFVFSFKSIKRLWGFGWKMFASSIVDNIFVDLYSLVIGKVYTAVDLALYNRGRQFPQLAMDSINSSLMTVAFPALSKLQDDPIRLREAMRKMIQVSSFVVMPMLAGLAAVSSSVVQLLLGDEWLGAAPYVAIACVSFAFYPFATANLQAIKAIGRSDYYLKLSLAKDIVSLLVLVVFCRYGVLTLAIAGACLSLPLSMMINAWPNKILLNYGVVAQIKDVLPTMICSVAMALVVWGVSFVRHSNMLLLMMIQIAVGVLFFYSVNLIFRPKALEYLCDAVPVVAKIFPRIRK